MNLDLQLLKKICTAYGAPGYEQDIRALVIEEVTPWVDELKVDNLGNILTLKKGENNPDGKKAMVAAHLDEIGFIVTHIDDDGFLRFHTLGGFDPKTLTAQRVIVHGKEDLIGVRVVNRSMLWTLMSARKCQRTKISLLTLGWK